MRIQYDRLGALAGDHRHGVDGLQPAKGFGLEIDLDAHLALGAGLHGAIEQGLQKPAIAAADVEAGIATVAEVARQLIAGQPHDVEDTDRAALHDVRGPRVNGTALEQHVALRHNQLHRDLALHVDVAQHRWTGRADIDEWRSERAPRDVRRPNRQRRFENEIGGARPERRIGQQLDLPRQRQPQ